MLVLNEAVLTAHLERLLERRADGGGAYLVEVMSHPGEGTMHPGNVNPSSLQGEYPAIQTAALIESIDVRKARRLAFAIGSFADQNAVGFEHAVELESRPPSQGGRAFLEKALHDPEMHAAILKGMP